MSHRQVDVDAVVADEDFGDEAQAQRPAAIPLPELMATVNKKTAEIQSHLQRGNAANALLAGLGNPVYGDADVAPAKDQYARVIIDILSSVRSTDIPNVLKSITDPTALDVLLKYVYKGMASPEQFNSNVLLAWHEKTSSSSSAVCNQPIRAPISGLLALKRLASDPVEDAFMSMFPHSMNIHHPLSGPGALLPSLQPPPPPSSMLSAYGGSDLDIKSRDSFLSLDLLSGGGGGSSNHAGSHNKKMYVLKACVNCKLSHVACNATRPCQRCIRLGKQATCVDAERKKRGRPKLSPGLPDMQQTSPLGPSHPIAFASAAHPFHFHPHHYRQHPLQPLHQHQQPDDRPDAVAEEVPASAPNETPAPATVDAEPAPKKLKTEAPARPPSKLPTLAIFNAAPQPSASSLATTSSTSTTGAASGVSSAQVTSPTPNELPIHIEPPALREQEPLPGEPLTQAQQQLLQSLLENLAQLASRRSNTLSGDSLTVEAVGTILGEPDSQDGALLSPALTSSFADELSTLPADEHELLTLLEQLAETLDDVDDTMPATYDGVESLPVHTNPHVLELLGESIYHRPSGSAAGSGNVTPDINDDNRVAAVDDDEDNEEQDAVTLQMFETLRQMANGFSSADTPPEGCDAFAETPDLDDVVLMQRRISQSEGCHTESEGEDADATDLCGLGR
ncbi:arp2/3 complex subunit [Sorochytrium milnesiophthora]